MTPRETQSFVFCSSSQAPKCTAMARFSPFKCHTHQDHVVFTVVNVTLEKNKSIIGHFARLVCLQIQHLDTV